MHLIKTQWTIRGAWVHWELPLISSHSYLKIRPFYAFKTLLWPVSLWFDYVLKWFLVHLFSDTLETSYCCNTRENKYLRNFSQCFMCFSSVSPCVSTLAGDDPMSLIFPCRETTLEFYSSAMCLCIISSMWVFILTRNENIISDRKVLFIQWNCNLSHFTISFSFLTGLSALLPNIWH